MKVIKMTQHTLAMFFILFCVAITFSQESSKEHQENVELLDSTVRYGKLDNGFTYYLQHNENPPGRIEMILSVKAGYFQESQNQIEYAHLLEHMGSFYTGKFPDLPRFTDSLGIYNHARTDYEKTYYTLSFAAGDQVRLNAAMQILHEWSTNMLFKPEHLALQSGAVIAEGRPTSPYDSWLLDTLSNTTLYNTNFRLIKYPKKVESMKHVNLNEINKFYQDWYRTDLQAAIIVGDVNVDSLETIIRKKFSDLKVKNNPKDPEIINKKFDLQLPDKNQYVSIRDSINKKRRIIILKKKINHDDDILRSKEDLKNVILQRLSMNILTKLHSPFVKQYEPPFIRYTNKFISNTLANRQLQVSLWEIPLGKDEDIEEKMLNFFKAYQVIKTQSSTSLLNNEKAKLLDDLITETKSSKDKALRFQDHFIYNNKTWTLDEKKKTIRVILNDIGVSEISEYITNQWNLNKNTDFVFFNVDDKQVPGHGQIIKWMKNSKDLSSQPVFNFKAIDSLPNRFSSVNQKKIYEDNYEENIIGLTQVKLNNGINLVFKPSAPASPSYNNIVSILGFKKIPVATSDVKNYIATTSSSDMVLSGDAGGYSKFQLQDFMLDQQIRLRSQTTENEFKIEGEFKAEDVKNFFNLLYLYVTDPNENSKAFQSWKSDKQELLSGYKYGLNDVLLKDISNELQYSNLPKLSKDDLREIDYSTYLRAYKKGFGNLSGYTFIITGDFNTDNMLPKITHYLSEFPTLTNQDSLTAEKYHYNYTPFEEIVHFNNLKEAIVEISFPVKVTKDVKTQVQLDLLVKKLNQMIFDRLRIDCYTPRASGRWMDYENGIYAFNISFDSELGNERKMIKYAMEEFGNLKQHGISKAWLETAIAQERSKYGQNLETFWMLNFWPKYLKRSLQHNEDPEDKVLKYESVISHFINLEELNKAAKKYLCAENRQQLIILPEI